MNYPLSNGVPEPIAAALVESFPVRELSRGEAVRREGEIGHGLFLVESGALGVWKGPPESAEGVQIARLGPGACIGEMSLVHSAPASASIVAAEVVRLREIKVETLPSADGLKRRVMVNLARIAATRLQVSEDSLRVAHAEHAQLQTVVSPMAAFVHWNLVGLGACMFSLPLVQLAQLSRAGRNGVSAALLGFFAVAAWSFVRRHHVGQRLLGLETQHIGRQLALGLASSLPMMAGCVGLKWAASHVFATNRPLFDPWLKVAEFGPATGSRWAALALASVALTVATEFVRCGLQASLDFSFRQAGRPAAWAAIAVSAMACGAVEVHAGVVFAWLNVLLGLVWGALYTYRPWFLAVATSHAAVAFFVGFVLGFP